MAMSVTAFLPGVGDDVVGGDRQFVLQGAHGSRREQPRHQLAQPGVRRGVVVDEQRLGQVELVFGDALGQSHDRALGVRRPQVAVAGDRLDVLVAADDPVAAVVEDRLRLLVPPDRRRLAQLGELVDGDAPNQDVRIGEVIPRGQERSDPGVVTARTEGAPVLHRRHGDSPQV
jgi:hypothetical protein